MKILVFVSKWIGNELINVLFSQFNDDEFTFIVSGPYSDEIIKKLQKNSCTYMILNQSTINWILQKDNYYFDWLLNLWGSYIFTQEMILKSKKSLNIHPSLLPIGRGSDPIVWAIINNEPAGVTLHQISQKIDQGLILFQEKVDYEFPISGENLYQKVINRCIEVFNEQWPAIRSNEKLTGIMQDESEKHNTSKRADLIDQKTIDINKNKIYRELLLRILANDFGDSFSLNAKYNDKLYSLKINIQEIEKEIKDE